MYSQRYPDFKEIEMADAYGTLLFTKTDDFDANYVELVDALNDLQWNTSDTKWTFMETSEGLHIATGGDSFGRDIQYPTVFPDKFLGVFIENQDGVDVLVEEPTEDDFDMASDFSYEPMTLEDLAQKLSPFIKSGSFEIACVANEKRRYVYFEKLKVCANGSAERSRNVSGSFHSLENVLEVV